MTCQNVIYSETWRSRDKYKGRSLLGGTISWLVNPSLPGHHSDEITRKRFFYSLLVDLPASHTICYLSLRFLCVICLSIRLISFWVCRISFIYIFTRTSLSIKWRQFLLYQSGSYLIVAYCIVVFSPSYRVLICQIFPMWFLDVSVSFATNTWKV